MRKLVISLLILVVVVGIATGGAVYYMNYKDQQATLADNRQRTLDERKKKLNEWQAKVNELKSKNGGSGKTAPSNTAPTSKPGKSKPESSQGATANEQPITNS